MMRRIGLAGLGLGLLVTTAAYAAENRALTQKQLLGALSTSIPDLLLQLRKKAPPTDPTICDHEIPIREPGVRYGTLIIKDGCRLTFYPGANDTSAGILADTLVFPGPITAKFWIGYAPVDTATLKGKDGENNTRIGEPNWWPPEFGGIGRDGGSGFAGFPGFPGNRVDRPASFILAVAKDITDGTNTLSREQIAVLGMTIDVSGVPGGAGGNGGAGSRGGAGERGKNGTYRTRCHGGGRGDGDCEPDPPNCISGTGGMGGSGGRGGAPSNGAQGSMGGSASHLDLFASQKVLDGIMGKINRPPPAQWKLILNGGDGGHSGEPGPPGNPGPVGLSGDCGPPQPRPNLGKPDPLRKQPDGIPGPNGIVVLHPG